MQNTVKNRQDPDSRAAVIFSFISFSKSNNKTTSIMADIKSLDGKLHVFEANPDLPCIAKSIFNCLACTPLGKATLVQHVVEKDGKLDIYGSEAMLCDGKVKMSPCPCTVYCGYGPCAAEWHFEQDKDEPTKYTGVGSAFACQTCEMCTNHNGDKFYYDADHDGTAEKPMIMAPGKNPMSPPCFAGIPVMKFYEVADRKGTPISSTMER